MNVTNPGSYESELNRMLKMNALPETKALANPLSMKILTKTEKSRSKK